MRRLIVAALALVACAQPGMPPGGPEEHVPPKLLSVSPDSGAVNVRANEVQMQFDEVLSERPAGGGASDLAGIVLVSPRDGAPRVGWHRTRLTIRGRKDFRPNTVYTVTLLPGLADLRGNVRKEPTTIVFSTGPTIPRTRVRGIVFDWGAGTPLVAGNVEAIARPDSVVYVGRADSTGRFELASLPPGTYTVIGYKDNNNNNEFDEREAFDSAHVVLKDSARVELLTFIHDTIGPRIDQVATTDSVTLRAKFDRPLDPSQNVSASMFRLERADSTAVPIRLAVSARSWDSTHATTAPAGDTTAARADTAARRVGPPAAPGRRAAAGDTTRRAPAPKPSRPSPVSEVVIVAAQPLTPGATYRLEARGARNLLGHAANSSRAFVVPKATAESTAAPGAPTAPRRRAPARPGADSTRRAPADTARSRPPADTARRAPRR
ncbi:MAG TPA: Ig-like domain-containing protein [Gemmatimonadaceae bacterium]